MDWFHCNQCFKRRGSKFAVSSCGHIYCDACVKQNQCAICGASCSYLAITDEMRPEEKVFFQDPLKLIQSRLKHITQIANFQSAQLKLAVAHYKHKSAELEKQLKEVKLQGCRQLSELRRENGELKKQLSELKGKISELQKPLSQRRVSTEQFKTDSAQKITLPVAVTSPVTPCSRPLSHVGSAESHRWSTNRGPSLSLNTPGSSTPLSSHSFLREHTPTPLSTPNRRHTPNAFQLQFMSVLSVQSPRY